MMVSSMLPMLSVVTVLFIATGVHSAPLVVDTSLPNTPMLAYVPTMTASYPIVDPSVAYPMYDNFASFYRQPFMGQPSSAMQLPNRFVSTTNAMVPVSEYEYAQLMSPARFGPMYNGGASVPMYDPMTGPTPVMAYGAVSGSSAMAVGGASASGSLFRHTESVARPVHFVHTVTKPVIQELREIIAPVNRVSQHVLPVVQQTPLKTAVVA